MENSDESIVPTQQQTTTTTEETTNELNFVKEEDKQEIKQEDDGEVREVVEDEMSDTDNDEMMQDDDELNISAISNLSTKNPLEDSFYYRSLELDKLNDGVEETSDDIENEEHDELYPQQEQHKILTQEEIEDMEKKYHKEIKSFFSEEGKTDEDIQLASETTSTAFSKSMDSFGKILYAQVVRHEERIETLTKSNKKLQEIVNKKNEKITKLQLQLSEMVKQIERYEMTLRQRMSPLLSPNTFSHHQQNPSTSSSYVDQASPRLIRQTNPEMTPPPPTPPLQTKLIKKPEVSFDSPQIIDRPNKAKKRKSAESSSTDQLDPTTVTPTPGTPSDSGSSPRPIVKSRSKTVFKLKPADCVNYNGNTFVLARAFEDKYKLKKMMTLYKDQGEGEPQLFLKDEDFKKLRIENPDNLSVFAYRTSLYTMDFVNFYMSNQ